MDFSKAFNSVSHSILPDKMSSTDRQKHNMMGEQLLVGQAQRVVVNEVASDWWLVINGVLQCSVLGTVLFNVQNI